MSAVKMFKEKNKPQEGWGLANHSPNPRGKKPTRWGLHPALSHPQATLSAASRGEWKGKLSGQDRRALGKQQGVPRSKCRQPGLYFKLGPPSIVSVCQSQCTWQRSSIQAGTSVETPSAP